jgi:hypothetical protein
MHVSELRGGNGPFVAGTFFDLGTVGYQQAEYALTVGVRAFEREGPIGSSATAVDEAEAITRAVVYRPADPSAFNGTVFVEWLNVSAGIEAAPLWMFTHRELIRSGAAWIGLSAQHVGIHGGASALEMMAGSSLVELDPERYGGLRHPGDRFSYDLFTRVGELARHGRGTILEDLPIERVLGMGESQSAFRLTTYVNDLDAEAAAFDGFLVHARGGTAAPLDDGQDPRTLREGPATPFRDGLRVPVLCVEAETDLITLGYQQARQADAEHLVVWEIAGTAHADVYTFSAGILDDGLQPIEALARSWRPPRELFGATLHEAVNAGPQHFVMDAAVRALDTWVRAGDTARPPASPRLELAGYGFAVDELGNAVGGIRTPHVDVPVSVLSGLGNGGNAIAFLAGSTVPFPPEQLRGLYGTKAGYLERFSASAADAASAGFLLDDELDEIVGIAAENVEL